MFTSNRGFSGSGYRMMSVKFHNDRLGLPIYGLVSMDHLQETSHCESYGHVTDDVMTPKYLRLNISETIQDTWLVSMGHG